MWKADAENRVHVDDPTARRTLSRALVDCLGAFGPKEVVVVCIGSDRSTGDSLGPLVGSRLAQHRIAGMKVRGTLDHPVHAANLRELLPEIEAEQRTGIVLAVDACLGRAENVGSVCVKPGPLKPGTGVNKTLPEVGLFHIVGVVNVGGFMEYFVLQNTRLSLVMRMADLIAESLADAIALHLRSTGGTQVAAALDRSSQL